MAAAHAVGGDLKPVACDLEQAVFPPLLVRGMISDKPAKDAGDLSAKGLVGTVSGTTLPLKLGVDFSKPGDVKPDLLLFDFTGQGKFDKGSAVPLRKVAAPNPSKQVDYEGDFGPAVVKVRGPHEGLLATVRGAYIQLKLAADAGPVAEGRPASRLRRVMTFTFGAAMEGKCRFGEREHAVRLIDNTGDFRFDGKGKYDRKVRSGFGLSVGDTVLIDTGDGTFSKSFVKAYFGQPVLVGKAWYELATSPDGRKVSAKPVQLKSGQIAMDTGKWEVVLVNGGKAFFVSGGKDPAAVPAGRYTLLYYREWSAPDAKGARAWLLAADMDFVGRGKGKGTVVSVSPGKVTKLALGSPLNCELRAVATGRSVTFSLDTPKTRGGLSAAIITRPGGWITAQPHPPKVRVLDAKGKTVHTAALEYG